MSYLKNKTRAGRSIWAFVCLSLLLFAATAQAQVPTLPALPTACDYTSEPANISLTAQNVPAGYSTVYLLVNMTSGLIVQNNVTAPVFNGVSRGLYYAVAAHYKGVLNNAQAGKLISDVFSSDLCLTYGTALGLKICPTIATCDYAKAPASVTFTANSVPGGVSTAYALVDMATNLITQVSSTASFSGIALGEYAITSVHYTGSLTALVAGNRLYDVTTQDANCLSVSNTIYVKVCNSPIAITGPPNGSTVASLNPPISGTAAPGASVTVTGGPGSTGGPCITTANASGVWSCSSITFPSGPNSVTATDGTTTAVSTFTATPPTSPPSLIVTGPINATTTTTPTIAGTATPGSVIAITDPLGATVCTTTASASGTFSCALTTPLPAGPNTLTVTATDPGGSTSVPVTFTAVPPASLTVAPTGPQTTTTPVISGTATPGSLVVITGPGPATLCTATADASGVFSCSVSVPAGPTTLTVTACTTGACSTTTASFTAVAPPTIAILSPADNTTQPAATNQVSGTATPGSTVVLATTGGNFTTTADPTTGAYSVTGLSFPSGPNTVTATASNVGGTATTASTFTIVGPPSLTLTSPVNVSTTTTPTIAGMATPGSVIAITDPLGATVCTTTASVSGTFSCALTTPLPAGPNTLTVTATDPGGSTSVPVTFTAVPPASLTVAPTGPQTTTAPVISGTATPGSLVVITGPGPATLCTATADASGLFSCSVSVPEGPNTLTVTATGPGGSTSVPVTFTTVAPPTVAILSPADGGTATTTPTISGTATPLASVTVLGPNSQSCVTTASASGTYSCASLTFAAGPNSVTAIAGNVGGISTPAVANFTAVQPTSNSAPAVTPDFTNVVAGIPATGNVLTNDTDPEGSPLTASVIGTPPTGLTLSPDGSYTYTAPVGTTAPVTVPIQVCDGGAPPVCATTILTLIPVPPTSATTNNAPIANPDAPKTTDGVPVVVAVLANDIDPEGQPLNNPVIVTQPTHGTAVVNPDGTVIYTPTAGYTGTDQLTYSVCDGGTPPTCSTALVTFTIDPTPPASVTNLPPVAIDDALLTQKGISATGAVAANDSDPNAGQTVTFTKLTDPANGTVMFSPTGSYTYTPSPTFVGSDLFTYQVCDNASPALCATATAHLTVPAVLPTLAIVSPDNTTATTTPTISGTATPNAVVTITGGPGSVGGPVSVTADNAGNYSTSALSFPSGPNTVTAIASNLEGISSPAIVNFTAVGPTSHVLVQAKVFLSGAYNTTTGLMRDDLRTKGLIPLGDPYSTPTYATNFPHTAGSAGTTIASGVLSVTGNNAIVDWVFVQLRDPLSASTVVSTRAALLQRDGDIVDLDGTSPLSFTVTPGSFFLSVRHRNHLGVMEQSPVVLSGSPTLVDFTLLTTVTYGTHAQRLVSTSVAALWPGNANQNKAVIYQGSGNDLGTVLSQVLLAPGNSVPPVRTYIVVGYLASDLNLDGTTIYQGSGNELGIVLGTVLLHPANSLPPVRTFIVSEQLP